MSVITPFQDNLALQPYKTSTTVAHGTDKKGIRQSQNGGDTVDISEEALALSTAHSQGKEAAGEGNAAVSGQDELQSKPGTEGLLAQNQASPDEGTDESQKTSDQIKKQIQEKQQKLREAQEKLAALGADKEPDPSAGKNSEAVMSEAGDLGTEDAAERKLLQQQVSQISSELLILQEAYQKALQAEAEGDASSLLK